MDAIKITRGRTRRSQGAGDALGGPSPAAAGGVGEGGETLRGRRSRCRLCPGGGGAGGEGQPLGGARPPEQPRGAGAGGGGRGTRRRPPGGGGSGKGEAGSGPRRRRGRRSPVPSKARRRGLRLGPRTGAQRRRRGGRRAGLRLPAPGRAPLFGRAGPARRSSCSAVAWSVLRPTQGVKFAPASVRTDSSDPDEQERDPDERRLEEAVLLPPGKPGGGGINLSKRFCYL